MEARNRLWLHRLAASVVMVVALAILMICTTRTVPTLAAARYEPAATLTPVSATSTPAAPLSSVPSASPSNATPKAGLGASLPSLIDIRTTGGAAAAEPLEALVSGSPDKMPAAPVRKSTHVAPLPPGQTPKQVATPDANLSAAEAAGRATLVIVNQSSAEVCYVYISPTDSDTWGEDWLGDDTIPPGRQRQFKLPAGEYDVKAEDCDGEVIEDHRAVDVSGKVVWTVEDVDEQADDDAAEAEDEYYPDQDDESPDNSAELEPVALTQYLCCGYTVGGTRIWGISYPDGWEMRYLPTGNPNDFVGAVFSSPDDNMEIVYIPSAWPAAGRP